MNKFFFKYRNAIMGLTATAFGYYAILMPHTVLLSKYRLITANYQIGREIPLGSKIQQKIEQVMQDLKLPDNVKNIIKPFNVFGLDLFHAGTFNTKYGAILGIPINFIYTKMQLREEILVNEEVIDWTQHNAQQFLNALVLSENAEKFGIAKEILQIQAEEPYFNSISLALIIALSWILYNTIVYRFQLRKRNVILCRTLYSVLTLFGTISWFGIKDYQSYHLDIKNDKALCKLGIEYIKGGQEFYEKILKRNIALRSLLGKEGKKIYTASGNEQTFLRQRHIPITSRKDFFDSHLHKLQIKIKSKI